MISITMKNSDNIFVQDDNAFSCTSVNRLPCSLSLYWFFFYLIETHDIRFLVRNKAFNEDFNNVFNYKKVEIIVVILELFQ